MKFLHFATVAFGLVLLTACGGGPKDQIVGVWTLAGLTDAGAAVELTECDQQTTWNFTTETAEALSDGTAVQKLEAKAPESCDHYGFDAKWTTKDGQLFVSTSRIGGVGGVSLAGLMEIVEATESKLVLKSMKRQITLTR